MRSALVVLVFVIKLVHCAHIDFSDNDKLKVVDRNRAKSEFYEKPIGNPKKFHKSSLKEIVSAKQKKRCDSCKESIRCKTQGKCDLCNRYCKDVEATTLPPLTEAPLVGSIQLYLDNENFVTQPSQNEVGPFGKSSRFYTVGAFGPGPKQNLLVRLLNIAQKDNLEKLVVLAKPKGNIESENPEHPIIIDTANAFQTIDGDQEIDAEVHTLNGEKIQQAIDLELTSKIDGELDKAIEHKQKMLGKSYLTGKEVDKIISKVLSMFKPPNQPEVAEDVVQIGSRMNAIAAPHITTKRSVPSWQLTKNHRQSLDEQPLVGARSLHNLNSKSNENLSPQLDYNQIQAESNSYPPKAEHSNKRTATKPKGQLLSKSVPNSQDYKGDSYLVKDDCTDDANESYDSGTGEDLLEYEPAPPTYFDDIDQTLYEGHKNYKQQESRNVDQKSFLISAPQSVSEKLPQQKEPKILNEPISNESKPESASQYLENPDEVPQNNQPSPIATHQKHESPLNKHQEPFEYMNEEPFNEDEINDEEVIVTLTQAPETYDTNSSLEDDPSMRLNNASDSLLGSNWFTDEIEKARMWWRSNVGMETPQNLTYEATDFSKIFDNQTDENLQVAESRTNLVNASHFTLILKNLEQKVENIADLVKKTCGKVHPEEENAAQVEPFFVKYKEEGNPLPVRGDTRTRKEPALVGNQIQVIELPGNETDNLEPITTFSQTEENAADPSSHNSEPDPKPHILDTAMQGIHGGANFLINKAANIADKLNEEVLNPKRTQGKSAVVEENDPTATADLDRGLFSPHDVTIGCSKEDSGEYLGKAQSEKTEKTKGKDPTVACSKEDSEEYVAEKLEDKKNPLQLRSGFESEKTATTAQIKDKAEENVACSKEDSEEYLGEQQHIKSEPEVNGNQARNSEEKKGKIELFLNTPKFAKKPNDNENVACSKESDEYVGKSEGEAKQVRVAPKNKLDSNLPSRKPIEEAESQTDSQNSIQINSKTSQTNEDVGCSKESEEYVGDQKKENLGETKTSPGNEEAVGCSKEEEYAVPFYPSYRSNNPKSSQLPSPNLPKFKQLPRIPALDNIFHRNNLPHNLREGSLPSSSQKSSKTNLPKISRIFDRNRNHNIPSPAQQPSTNIDVFSSDPEEDAHHIDSKIPSDNQRMFAESDNSEISQRTDLPQGILPITQSQKRIHPTIVEPQENVFHQAEPSQQHQLNTVSPIAENVRYLPPSKSVPQNEGLAPPALNQRFGEQEQVGPDGFHVHRPKHLQDWPELSAGDEILGAKKDKSESDDGGHKTSSAMYTQNPFSIFGKVVPQLNNTEISFHHIPSNKIYFVGTGMQLPLNMKQHEDGSYQLSVDIDKLCNNCNDNMCNKKLKDQLHKANQQDKDNENIDDVALGVKPPPSEEIEDHPDISQDKTVESKPNKTSEDEKDSMPTRREEVQPDHQSTQLRPQKIEIVAMDVPKFRDRRVPYGNKIAARQNTQNPPETQANRQDFLEFEEMHRPKIHKTFKYRPLVEPDVNDERKRSEISKRSPKLELELPSLTSSGKSLDERKSRVSSRNSVNLDNLDESLKNIDHNMKQYFDRRQKLDDFYGEQNRRNLEQPDDKKDVVKRRVTLVNNVLAWMKSIAVKDPSLIADV